MTEVEKVRFHTKKVPPEGGFGYIVMIGLAISLGCSLGACNCIGLMYSDFIASIGGETSAITIIMGFYSIALSVAGLFANAVTKTFSMRTTATLGGMLFFFGSLMSVFATSVEYLIISFGVFEGGGVGLIITAGYSTFNDYFVKKRVLMMSITQTIVGIVVMGYPIMIQFCLNTFGFRGALAVIAAIHGHAVLGMLVMHPVKWHYKVIEVRDEEAKPFISSKLTVDKTTHTLSSLNGDELPNNTDQSNEKNEKLDDHSGVINKITPESKANVDMKPVSYEHRKVHELHSVEKRLSVVSGAGMDQSIVIDGSRKDSNGIWRTLIESFDLSLLKDIVYVNIILGLNCVSFADSNFFILQPMYLFQLNISKNDTALIMAITAGFDLGYRLFLSIISLFITIKARTLYTTGAIVTIISRFVFLSVSDFMDLVIVSAAMGFLKTLIHLPVPLVISEYLPKERFAAGYGLYIFLHGIFSFILSPFIGWVRDTTKSYVICFHTLSFIMGFCVALWMFERAWFHFYPRKTATDVERVELDMMKRKM